MQTLSIKNMVCDRCISSVKSVLDELGISYQTVSLGQVLLNNPIPNNQLQSFEKAITELGFELLKDKSAQLISQVKSSIIQLIYKEDGLLKTNLSTYLSEKLNTEYTLLSTMFSEHEQNTIEKYYIAQKIERVKELLTYNQLTLSEIAHQLNYSSVAHLSSQFKKITNTTPTLFKQNEQYKRRSLDQIN
jgi:AraC-like DNA-binding protein